MIAGGTDIFLYKIYSCFDYLDGIWKREIKAFAKKICVYWYVNVNSCFIYNCQNLETT